MTQHKCVQLDHVLQMYHAGYHKGYRASSNREPPVESATSITVQHPGRVDGHDVNGLPPAATHPLALSREVRDLATSGQGRPFTANEARTRLAVPARR